MKCTKLTRSLLLALSMTMAVDTTNCMKSTAESWMTTGMAIIGNILLAKISLSVLWEQPETFPFNYLPQDIQNEIKILIFTGTIGNNLEEAASAIRALAQVNKKLNTLINDPQFSSELIEKLAQKFSNGDVVSVCNALQTQGALKYLANHQTNPFGFTPLMSMLSNGPNFIDKHYNQLSRLSGQYINLTTPRGETALLIALISANLNISEILKKSGNLRQLIKEQQEAIELYQKVIQLLLNAGADPEIADNDGLTPLQEAMNIEDQTIIQMIQDAINKKHEM